jgi:16S rRNA (guanine966-N2)-methyltransferase
MRVVAGQLRGRRIEAPAGDETRPTSDRVRQALFSMLEARVELAGVGALDLYAGSGALGLEALSRGAACAVLVDHRIAATRMIERNARALGVEARCQIVHATVTAALETLARERRGFGLVLCDPPYADEAAAVLAAIEASGVVLAGGALAFEHSARNEPPERHGALFLLARRRHGQTVISLYGSGEAAPASVL